MKLKNRKIHKVLLLQLLMAVMLFPMQAFAAEYQCSVSVPVEVQVTGDSIPAGNEYTVVLEAAEEETQNPMPEVTEITIKDGGSAEFGPITYTKPDDYRYKIRQEAGNTANFTYDAAVFTVTVRVVNDEETGGLKAEIWAIRDESENKTDAIRFENTYQKPADPSGGDPGSGDGSDEEIAVIPTAVKQEAVIAQIPIAGIPEVNQPAGGQTGDSAYPVLWTALMAAAVIAFAIVIMKRKKNEDTEE